MFKEPLPQTFYKLKSNNILKIIDNNIILEDKSFETTNSFIVAVNAIFVTFPYLIVFILFVIYLFFRSDFLEKFFDTFSKNQDLIGILSLAWFFIAVFFFRMSFRVDSVLDREKKIIYTVLNIFDLILIKFNKLCFEDIAEVGNNVAIYQGGGGRGRARLLPLHPITNRVHIYLVSFLLKNGKILSIPIGNDIKSYYNSQDIAIAISDLWYLPLKTCQDDCRLVLNKKEASKGNYTFEEQKIEPFTIKKGLTELSKILAIVFFAFITICTFFYITGAINSKRGLTKERVIRDLKDLFGIDLRKSNKTRK